MSRPTRWTALTIRRIALEEFPGGEPAGLGRPGSRRKCRVEHIDIDRDVDCFRPVQSFLERVVEDSVESSVLDFCHQVPPHALGVHPVDNIGWRPIASQTHLDEVAAGNRALFDEPAHGCAVTEEAAPLVRGRVCVGIEVNHADVSLPEDVRDCCDGRQRDAVVATEHEGDGSKFGHLAHLLADGFVASFDTAGHYRSVAVVEDPQVAQWLNARLQVMEVRPRFEAARMARGP